MNRIGRKRGMETQNREERNTEKLFDEIQQGKQRGWKTKVEKNMEKGKQEMKMENRQEMSIVKERERMKTY